MTASVPCCNTPDYCGPGTACYARHAVSAEHAPVSPPKAHDLVVSLGDCELIGACSCGTDLGYIAVNQSLDLLGRAWEQHVMQPVRVLRRPVEPEAGR